MGDGTHPSDVTVSESFTGGTDHLFVEIGGYLRRIAASLLPVSTAVQSALGKVTGIRTVTDSSTLELGDAGGIVEGNKASAMNITVPQNSAVAFPIGTTVDLIQYGAGQITVVADTNVTIRSAGSKLKLTGQYSGASLYKRDTNEWVLNGDIKS